MSHPFAYISLTVSSISVFWLLWPICFICFVASYRNKFSYQLLVSIFIGDVLHSLGILIAANKSNNNACAAGTFIQTLGGVATFLWIAATMAVIQKTITGSLDPETEKKLQKYLHLIWCWAFICALIPTATGQYDKLRAWCWIDDSDMGIVFRLVFYYLELVVAWLYIFFSSIRIWTHLRHIKKKNRNLLLNSGTIATLKYYPLVFFCTKIFACIRRTFNIKGGEAPVALIYCHVLTSSLYGVINTIMFFLLIWKKQRHSQTTGGGTVPTEDPDEENSQGTIVSNMTEDSQL